MSEWTVERSLLLLYYFFPILFACARANKIKLSCNTDQIDSILFWVLPSQSTKLEAEKEKKKNSPQKLSHHYHHRQQQQQQKWKWEFVQHSWSTVCKSIFNWALFKRWICKCSSSRDCLLQSPNVIEVDKAKLWKSSDSSSSSAQQCDHQLRVNVCIFCLSLVYLTVWLFQCAVCDVHWLSFLSKAKSSASEIK